ncbi:MAG: PEP-CTERM sorting domain-containing protein, partial [Planctomycetota bacterium]
PVGNVSPGDMFTASGQLDVIFPAPGDDQGRGESVHVALLATYPTSADGVTIGSDPNFICSNEGRSFQRVMWRGNSAAEIQQQAFHDELVDGDLAYLDRVIFDDYESSNDFSRVSGLPLDMADIISGDPVNLNYDLALGSFSDLTASGTGSAFLQLTPVPEPASLGALGGLLVLSLRRRRGDAVGR